MIGVEKNTSLLFHTYIYRIPNSVHHNNHSLEAVRKFKHVFGNILANVWLAFYSKKKKNQFYTDPLLENIAFDINGQFLRPYRIIRFQKVLKTIVMKPNLLLVICT